jgi:VWFA-related protein
MRAGIAVAAILLAALAALPQQPPREEAPETTIRVDVDLVSLYCTVRDKKGGYLKDLTKEDFEVYEDGASQEIRNFSRETDLPLTIGLLVDVSGSQANLIEIERRAASQFFEQVLRQKDLAFLISFGSEAELLQDLTGSKPRLIKALGDLRLTTSVGGIHPGPVPTAPRRGTILYDAVYLAANEILRPQVGRKVIVLISDGVDVGSRVKKEDALTAAHRGDSIIYSVYYVDSRAYGGFGGGGGEGDLRRMSEETGGRLFKVGRKYTLEDIFRDIEEEVRSQYVITYSPANPSRDGSFRRVEIKTGNRDYRVQARKGYYAPKS